MNSTIKKIVYVPDPAKRVIKFQDYAFGIIGEAAQKKGLSINNFIKMTSYEAARLCLNK